MIDNMGENDLFCKEDNEEGFALTTLVNPNYDEITMNVHKGAEYSGGNRNEWIKKDIFVLGLYRCKAICL